MPLICTLSFYVFFSFLRVKVISNLKLGSYMNAATNVCSIYVIDSSSAYRYAASFNSRELHMSRLSTVDIDAGNNCRPMAEQQPLSLRRHFVRITQPNFSGPLRLQSTKWAQTSPSNPSAEGYVVCKQLH